MVNMLMPSLLGLTLCFICLTGTTWSWFTDNVTATMQSVKAADYDIIVDIQDGEKLEDGKYNLSQKTEGNGYKITVKANGSASTGFFRVSGPDGFLPLYSTQLAPGEIITFTFYPSTSGEYLFESAWGTYSGSNTINNYDIIGTPLHTEDSISETEKSEAAKEAISAATPIEDESVDKERNEKQDETASAVQPTEAPANTEETIPPHRSSGEND